MSTEEDLAYIKDKIDSIEMDVSRLLSLGGDRVSWEDLSDDGGNPPKFLQGTIVHFVDDDLTMESGVRYLVTQTYGPNGETATLTQTRVHLNIFTSDFTEDFI
ncbi:hypothetical protein LCGC14_1169150 [marine sediment metagenome]|uniref:Uncharacterized protein n=1 Tax=marine sediment metagenome TaxID=412755 RepID=A0A0F9PVW3_9ZZZZ